VFPIQAGQLQAGSEQPQNLIWTLAGMDTVPQLLLLVGGAAVDGVGGGGGGGVVVVVVGGCKIYFHFYFKYDLNVSFLPFHRRIVQPGAWGGRRGRGFLVRWGWRRRPGGCRPKRPERLQPQPSGRRKRGQPASLGEKWSWVFKEMNCDLNRKESPIYIFFDESKMILKSKS